METGDLFLKKKLKDGVVEYKLNVMVFDLGADSKFSKTTVEIKIKQNTKRYPFRGTSDNLGDFYSTFSG